MRCVLCEKLILSDRGDSEEMVRLLRTGELQFRKIACSFYNEYYARDNQTDKIVKVRQRRFQEYPVCGDCIRKEKAEEKEEQQEQQERKEKRR